MRFLLFCDVHHVATKLAEYITEYGMLHPPHMDKHLTRAPVQHPYETMPFLFPYILLDHMA
jgi:hypothetical protein